MLGRAPDTPPGLVLKATRPQRRLRLFFAACVAAQALGWLAAAAGLDGIGLSFPGVRPGRAWAAAWGLGGLVAGALCLRLRAPWAATVCSLCLGATVLLLAGHLAPRRGDTPLQGQPDRPWASDAQWTQEPLRKEPLPGWSGLPGAVARQHHHDFGVAYRLDGDSRRQLLAPPAAQGPGELWLLGCPATSGVGLEDEEGFAHRLETQAGPQMQVRHLPVSGCGTAQALSALQEQLRTRPAPGAVLYGWVGHPRMRNHLRQPWSASSPAPATPGFDIQDGRLQWRSPVPGRQAGVPHSPRPDDKERQATVALVREMVTLTQARGVPLVLLVLQDDGDPVLGTLRSLPGLNVLDLSRASQAVHPHDGHPTAAWHRAVARTVAADPWLAQLTGRAPPPVPETVSAVPLRDWQVSYVQAPGQPVPEAVSLPEQPGHPLRVVPGLAWTAKEPWALNVQRDGHALQRGAVYELELRARSSGPRPLRYSMARAQPPWTNLGLNGDIWLGTKWRTYRRYFTATDHDANGRLALHLGGDAHSVELAGEPAVRRLDAADAARALAAMAAPAWKLSVPQPGAAHLEHVAPVAEAPLSAVIDRLPDNDPWSIQLQHGGLPLEAGRQYTLELRLQTQAPRKLQLAITRSAAPWDNLGFYADLDALGAVQTLLYRFQARHADAAAQLVIALGGERAGVELHALRLFDDTGKALLDTPR